MDQHSELRDALHEWVGCIQEARLQAAVREVMLWNEFDRTNVPGSFSMHHAYEHGLRQHTLEVCKYAWAHALTLLPQVDRDVVLAASLCHDVLKIRDYTLRVYFHGQTPPVRSLWACGNADGSQTRWVLTEYHETIRHIHGSYALFTEKANAAHVAPELVDAVGHAILAHHGPVQEWGRRYDPRHWRRRLSTPRTTSAPTLEKPRTNHHGS